MHIYVYTIRSKDLLVVSAEGLQVEIWFTKLVLN